MKIHDVMRMGPILSAGILLTACGGGGVASTPSPTPTQSETPTPSPPTPTPAAGVMDLTSNQTFAADGASSDVSFNLTSQSTIIGKASRGPVTISFNASNRSYSVTAHGQTQTFTQSDIVRTTDRDVTYSVNGAAGTDYLTLQKRPYTSSYPLKYVGMGYWQRNQVTGDRQDTGFNTFTYGYASSASAVPHSGTATFGVDVFGLAATPGYQPRVFDGHGRFDIDFLNGVFSTKTGLTETGLVTGGGVVGGGIELVGSGHLTSGNGFSGNVLYGGNDVSVAGTIEGQFYGPSAQELGAVFSASNPDGSTVSGGMTGYLEPQGAKVNLTLTNLVTSELFYSQEAALTIYYTPGGTNQASTTIMTSQFTDQTSGNLQYSPGRSDLLGGAYTVAYQVPSSDPNFISYKKTVNGQDTYLDVFKTGTGNTKLALTYMSFGRWSSTQTSGANSQLDQVHFVYGLETPARLLSARTGMARYNGLVYGAGATQSTSTRYDVTGTALFDVNFTNQTYSGALQLNGKPVGNGGSVNFGSLDFSGSLATWTAGTAVDLMQGEQNVGVLTTRFYGPNGEEIGGPFEAHLPSADTTHIAGIAIAKTQ